MLPWYQLTLLVLKKINTARARLNTEILIKFQICLKYISPTSTQWQWNFAHYKTAQLFWNVQIFIVIWLFLLKL